VLRLIQTHDDDRSAMDALSDDDLFALAVRGDERAFTHIVRRHEARLRRFLSRYVGSEADDLAQDVLATVWRTRARYQDQGRFTVFLYRCARNRALSHLRWRKVRRVFAERRPPDEPERPRGLEKVLAAERDAGLARVVAGLPANYKDVVVLRYAEGLDYETISAITGVGVSTLRSRAHRGLAMLRERVERAEARE
jgi:RNA polymerase sigma-70 factor (ECF subfamily)